MRARAKIFGTAEKPRLSVFRSNRNIYAQLIDDEKGRTLVSVSSLGSKKSVSGGKVGCSEAIGVELAKKALASGIKKAVFDRGAYKYHGRVKAVAEGSRKEGLKI